VFAVKLPIAGVHGWLPVAHVEAPTYGRMILAGVLLKLGGVGLVRLKPVIALEILERGYAFFIFAYLVITVLCYYQMDFKKTIAYSSIFHIGLIPILFLINTNLRDLALTLLIVIHGVISPLLFYLVGVSYRKLSTRHLSLLKGLFLRTPHLSFFASLTFVATLPAPPFGRFIAEMFRFLSITLNFVYIILLLCITLFLSLVYNLR